MIKLIGLGLIVFAVIMFMILNPLFTFITGLGLFAAGAAQEEMEKKNVNRRPNHQ